MEQPSADSGAVGWIYRNRPARFVVSCVCRKTLLRLVGRYADSRLSRIHIRRFAEKRGIADWQGYGSLNAFFARPRANVAFPAREDTLGSPCQALVCAWDQLRPDAVVQVKGVTYPLAELLDEDSSLQNPAAPITHVQDGAVAFEGVSFSYSSDMEKLCLRDVSFSIPSGHTVGILGGTGSSKSTLVQLIPRLYDATSGRVLVGGVDVRAYDMESLRENVAMVLQKNELFSGTIRENLLWGNENATDEELVWACRLAQADDFIRAFPDGYDTHIEQGGANVSGGQKQRLCIARALLKRPKILILDDSTSAVDTRTDALIRQAFRSELPDTTKFIIAQRVSSIQDADTILVLDNGAINGIGTHEQLLQTNRIYQEVFTSQTKGEQMHA